MPTKRIVDKSKSREIYVRALNTGKLERLSCEICGDKKSEGHHEDYSLPLKVRWLCRKHHGEWHRSHPRVEGITNAEWKVLHMRKELYEELEELVEKYEFSSMQSFLKIMMVLYRRNFTKLYK